LGHRATDTEFASGVVVGANRNRPQKSGSEASAGRATCCWVCHVPSRQERGAHHRVSRTAAQTRKDPAPGGQLPGAGPSSASTLSVHFSLGFPRIGRRCASSGRGSSSSSRATRPQNPRFTGAPVPRAHRAGANLPESTACWWLADQRRGQIHRALLNASATPTYAQVPPADIVHEQKGQTRQQLVWSSWCGQVGMKCTFDK
jgi:hypothetical protein